MWVWLGYPMVKTERGHVMCTDYDTGVNIPRGPVSGLESSNKAPSQISSPQNLSFLSAVNDMRLYKSPNQLSSALLIFFNTIKMQCQWPENS